MKTTKKQKPNTKTRKTIRNKRKYGKNSPSTHISPGSKLIRQKGVPSTLNYKPSPGGLEFKWNTRS